ncbi:MAG: anhydro-N-acetylmuramic acid kinase, partial [Armatimonadetes bacterium]|nr:anhydro-N-acetylmuramic acid kinase [Armatimonadota bacterium]
MQIPTERLAEYATKDHRLLIGLMSGTSADAVTAAAVRVTGAVPDVRAECLGFRQHPLPDRLQGAAQSPERLTAAKVAVLNVRFGEVFAEATLALMEDLGLRTEDVDAVASHGQTIAHLPD